MTVLNGHWPRVIGLDWLRVLSPVKPASLAATPDFSPPTSQAFFNRNKQASKGEQKQKQGNRRTNSRHNSNRNNN